MAVLVGRCHTDQETPKCREGCVPLLWNLGTSLMKIHGLVLFGTQLPLHSIQLFCDDIRVTFTTLWVMFPGEVPYVLHRVNSEMLLHLTQTQL